MTSVELMILSLFAVVAIMRLVLTRRLVLAFRRPPNSPLPDQELPFVIAVMALRGGDEFLSETLRRLTTMDYPRYRLRLVIDSPHDPARAIVEKFLRECQPSNTDVMYLGDRPLHCSGKVAGMLRGSADLPGDCSVVAVFDGDALVHQSCLRELVSPLMNGAAVATGNRWYAPAEPTLGSMVRFLWNGCAVTVMNAVNIPWGGCMAMRSSVISHPELRSRLESAFGEDSTIATFVLQNRQRVQFVPEATIVNPEDCSVRGFYNFLVRQYLTVRLHNPHWIFVFGSNFLLGFLLIGANIYFCTGADFLWWQIVAGYAMICLSVVIELATGAALVRRQKRLAGVDVPRFTVWHWLMSPVALTLLNHMNFVACLHAQFIRRHEWRGITYRFPGAPAVEIIGVKPLATGALAESTEQ
ncbi:MAG: glycosyltransferase family 2 protein [Planctomycetaceae bacterium]